MSFAIEYNETPSSTNMESEQPAKPRREKKSRSGAYYFVLAAVLFASIQVYSLLSPIILSLLLIILITLAVNPVVSRLRSWTGGRKRATGLILVGVLAIGGLSVWASVVPLRNAVSTLSEALPEYWERIQRPLIKMEQRGQITEDKLAEEVSAEIALETPETGDAPPESYTVDAVIRPVPRLVAEVPAESGPKEGSIRSSLGAMIMNAVGDAKGVVLDTTAILIVLVTVFFGVIFTLMNPRPIFGALFSLVPERHHGKTVVIMVRVAKFVPRWAGSVLISMGTIGSLFFMLMWPIFGFADALMLGIIACLLSAIPILGPILTLIPALLLAIGQGGMTPVWVLLAYGAVQALESNVILPMVMSRGMNLHPVAVIFAMLIAIAAFGVLGVIIAAPLVAIVAILHDEIYRKRFLPTSTDEDLERLARASLLEKRAVDG